MGGIFPDVSSLPKQDLVVISDEPNPEIILEGYTLGYFPMPHQDNLIGWYNPMKRAVLEPHDFQPSKSLKKLYKQKKFDLFINRNFVEVIKKCANPERPYGWIDSTILDLYTSLYDQGWAHSFEVWEDDELVGGLYGIGIDGLFAGESMFHEKSNTSKIALYYLIETLINSKQNFIIDAQWLTPHLSTLGFKEINRESYQQALNKYINRREKINFQS